MTMTQTQGKVTHGPLYGEKAQQHFHQEAKARKEEVVKYEREERKRQYDGN
jgi:hypothetical protein